ncbi:unnamed protein product, partial [Brenthis ino]
MLARLDISCEIIILTETWYSKILNAPILLSYDSYCTTNNQNPNDGVIAYIKQSSGYIVEEKILTDASCLLIRVSTDTVVLGIYRSPSERNIDNFLRSLDVLPSDLSNYSNIVLVGDLNIDITQNNIDKNSDQYLNLLATHGLLPGHVYPTRDRTCLDPSMIKAKHPSLTIVIETSLTDHYPVLTCIKLKHNSIITKNTNSRKIHYKAILDELKLLFSCSWKFQ